MEQRQTPTNFTDKQISHLQEDKVSEVERVKG